MAATFDPALTAPKDRIRQRIGDTVPARARVQDETINAYLTAGMSELQAAIRLCLDLAGFYASVGTVTIDDQQQRGEDIYQHYLDLAARLGKEEAVTPPTPTSAGAILVGGLNDCRGPLEGCCDIYGGGIVGRYARGGP